MASFDFDQAEGLRRMLAGPKPRVVTFLSATPGDDKAAMLVNLGASLVQAGNDVMIVDGCTREHGVARHLEMERHVSLLQVARQECALNQVVQHAPQGFQVATLVRDGVAPQAGSDEARRLAKAFDVLVKGQGGIVIVDGELQRDGSFAVPVLAESEIVVQVSTSATSITNAYALVKRLAQAFGRRPNSCARRLIRPYAFVIEVALVDTWITISASARSGTVKPPSRLSSPSTMTMPPCFFTRTSNAFARRRASWLPVAGAAPSRASSATLNPWGALWTTWFSAHSWRATCSRLT